MKSRNFFVFSKYVQMLCFVLSLATPDSIREYTLNTTDVGHFRPFEPKGPERPFYGPEGSNFGHSGPAPSIICYIFSLYYSLILFIIYPHEKHVGLQIADKEIIVLAELDFHDSIKFHFIRGIYEKN